MRDGAEGFFFQLGFARGGGVQDDSCKRVGWGGAGGAVTHWGYRSFSGVVGEKLETRITR